MSGEQKLRLVGERRGLVPQIKEDESPANLARLAGDPEAAVGAGTAASRDLKVPVILFLFASAAGGVGAVTLALWAELLA